MADEKELHDLRERIGRLSFGDQFRLLEWILADHRRRCDEDVAARRAANAEYLEQVKLLLELERQHGIAGDKRAG
jgi:hypothetical protein